MKVPEIQSEQQLEQEYFGRSASSATLARFQTLHYLTPSYGLHQGVLYFHNVLLFNGARINVMSSYTRKDSTAFPRPIPNSTIF